jgi:diadenosine tetraphosphate (Ap4A) HIT family hydrolase
MECVFCQNQFKNYSIEEYTYWSLQVFADDQYYIGRSVAVLKDRHAVDITELTASERYELFEDVLPDIKNSLENTFDPNLYNYASLGNDCRHFHLHIIPRYKSERIFRGMQFTDEFWNQTYAQDYKNVKLTKTQINELQKVLSQNIEAM